MNLLIAAPYYAPAWAYGGPVPFLRSLSRELAQLPASHVRVLTSTALAPSDDGTTGLDVVDGVTVERLPRAVAPWPRSYFRMPTLRSALRRELERTDCALLHGTWTDVNRIGASECQRANVPYVVYTHGTFETWALAHHGLKKLAYFPLFERAVLRQAAGIVISNDVEAQELRARGISVPIRRIPGGVDLPGSVAGEPEPSVLASLSHRPFVLYLGRLDRQKGVDLLIEAFAASLAAADYALVLAGPDSARDQTRLQASVDRLRLREHVLFPGLVVGATKDWLLRNAAIYAHISRSEGTSMSVLEALSYGLPAILGEGAAFPELEGTGAARIVRLDPDAVADALRAAARGALGANSNTAGIALIRQRFAWPAIALRMAEFVQECVR